MSEMDLVFAEEKYSKSGQLEKVRQHFGKEHLFFIIVIADVISQAKGATIQTKETILLFGMNQNSALFPLKSGSAVFIPARSVTVWKTVTDWKYG